MLHSLLAGLDLTDPPTVFEEVCIRVRLDGINIDNIEALLPNGVPVAVGSETRLLTWGRLNDGPGAGQEFYTFAEPNWHGYLGAVVVSRGIALVPPYTHHASEQIRVLDGTAEVYDSAGRIVAVLTQSSPVYQSPEGGSHFLRFTGVLVYLVRGGHTPLNLPPIVFPPAEWETTAFALPPRPEPSLAPFAPV